MNSATQKANQILVKILVVTLALAAVAAYLTASQETKEYNPSSPERIVQMYLRDVIAKKNEGAVQYLAQGSNCDATDLDRSWMPENVRVNLRETRMEGNRAFVDVAVDIASGGPFDDYYTENHTYRLIRENSAWRILGIPWPMYSCDEVTK